MKTITWLVLVLALFLAGCAAGTSSGYEPAPYERPYYESPYSPTPWYLDNSIPPLPVNPEAG